MCVSSPPSFDFTGPVDGPGATLGVLPSLLLPKHLLESTPGLIDQLTVTFSLSANISIRSNQRGRQDVATQTGRMFAVALRAAFDTMLQDMNIQVRSLDSSNSSPLGGFMVAILPAIAPLANRLPAVGNGQLLFTGSLALMATSISYAGFLPPLDSPVILAALTKSLDAALKASVTST